MTKTMGYDRQFMEKVENFVRSCGFSDKVYDIKYDVVSFGEAETKNGTTFSTLSVKVEVSYRDEVYSTVVDLLKIPEPTENGYQINGVLYEIVSTSARRAGLNTEIIEGHDFAGKCLRITSAYKPDMYITFLDKPRSYPPGNKHFKTRVFLGSKEKMFAVPLYAVMKVLGNKTVKEIAADITAVAPIFSDMASDKMKMEDCINAVKTFIKNIKSWEIGNTSSDYYIRETLLNWFGTIKLAKYAKYDNLCSVASRATRLCFAESINCVYFVSSDKVEQKKFNVGDILTEADVKQFGLLLPNRISFYTDVDSREVISIENRSSCLFNALGYKLGESITFVNSESGETMSYTQGDIITPSILKDINDFYGEKSLVVENTQKKRFVLHRKLRNEGIVYDDILTFLNIYQQYLMGLLLDEDVSLVTNRNIVTPLQKLTDALDNTLSRLTFCIKDVLQSNPEYPLVNNVSIALTNYGTKDQNMLLMMQEKLNSERQMPGMTNILHRVSQSKKIASSVGKTVDALDLVDVKIDQTDFLDPVEQPKSKSLGKQHRLCVFTEVNNGVMLAPYLVVSNGVCTDDVVKLTPADVVGKNICEWSDKLTDDVIKVRRDGDIYYVKRNEVDYKEYSSLSSMSTVRTIIPFQGNCAPRRLLMGVNEAKQSLPLVRAERPVIGTGGESIIDGLFITAEDIVRDFFDKSGMLYDDRNVGKVEITLVNVITPRPNYRCLIFNTKDYGNIEYEIYFGYSEVKSLYGMRINTKQTTYVGRDIVCYNIGLDTKKYDRVEYLDYGGYKIDSGALERGLGFGKNLLVAFKTFESSSIEDSLVINGALVNSGDLAVVVIKNYELDVIKQTDLTITIGVHSYAPGLMSSGGLISVGSHVLPGDPLISYIITSTGSTNTVERVVRAELEGEVIFVSERKDIDKNMEVTVLVANIMNPQVGDKMAGRYGNKGVIGKIVPSHLMPYDSKTGEPIDLILNPLGLPGRMNFGQLFEAVLGYAMKSLGKIAIISPFHPDTSDVMEKYANGIESSTRYLTDPLTGKEYLRPVTVGVLYMLKMEQLAYLRVKALGTPTDLDPIFQQPVGRIENSSGRKFGEMESWCLTSSNCVNILRDLYTIHSSDQYGRKNLLASMADDVTHNSVYKDIPGERPGSVNRVHIGETNNNINMRHIVVVTRPLGIELSVSDNMDGLKVLPLTDRDMSGMIELPYTDVDALENPTRDNGGKYGNTVWKAFDLQCKIVNPFLLMHTVLKDLFIVMCEGKNRLMTKEDFTMLISGKYSLRRDNDIFHLYERLNSNALTGQDAIEALFSADTFGQFIANYNAREATGIGNKFSDSKIKVVVDELVRAGFTTKDFLISRFPVIPYAYRLAGKVNGKKVNNHSLTILYSNLAHKISAFVNNRTSENYALIYQAISELIGINFFSDMTTSPEIADARNIISLYSKSSRGSEINHGYFRSSLLSKKQGFSGWSVVVPSSDMDRGVFELGVPWYIALRMFNEIYRYYLEENLYFLRNRTRDRYRAMEPLSTINFNAIFDIVEATIKSDSVMFSGLINTVYEFNPKVFQPFISKQDAPVNFWRAMYLAMRELIKEFTEVRLTDDHYRCRTWKELPKPNIMVLMGRQPSLHKFNTRGYYPYLLDGYAQNVNTLLCKGYNMDFDGDTAWTSALISKESIEEALEKLMANVDAMNIKDGNLILDMSQDNVLGAYCMTMLRDNSIWTNEEELKNVLTYDDIDKLEYDLFNRVIEPWHLVILLLEDRKYLSTAGRVLFNGLFRDGFTDRCFENSINLDISEEYLEKLMGSFCEMKYDGLLVKNKKGSIDGVNYLSLQDILNYEYVNGEGLYILHKLVKYGFFFSDICGISINLDDLSCPVDLNPYISELSDATQQSNEFLNLGLYSKSAIANGLSKKSRDILGKLKEDIRATMSSDYRNRNLFIIVDSGARGNWEQVLHGTGMLGILNKNFKEAINSPILSNYGTGLSSMDFFQNCYSSRLDAYAAESEITDAGYSTRICTYLTAGYKIVEEDCGCGEDEFDLFIMPVRYSSESPRVLRAIEGETEQVEVVDWETLSGYTLLKEDPSYVYVKQLLEDEQLTLHTLESLFSLYVPEIHTNFGIFKVIYRMDKLSRDTLIDRESRDLPYLDANSCITEETLSYIEDEQMDTVYVRTVLSCRSINGVCQKCYGRVNGEYLPVGYHIGITSAQAICEQSAQVSLNNVHNLGSSDTQGKAINEFRTFLKGNMDSDSRAAFVAVTADIDGMISRITNGAGTIIHLYDVEKNVERYYGPVQTDTVIVHDRVYVKRGTRLTKGYAPLHKITEDHDLLSLRNLQLDWLGYYLSVFQGINIKVKNFEILVRVQTSFAKIIKSSDAAIKAGTLCDYVKINDSIAKGNVIEYILGVGRHEDLVKEVSGGLSLMCFEDFSKHFGGMFGTTMTTKSFISDIFIGNTIGAGKIDARFIERDKTSKRAKDDFSGQDFVPASEEYDTWDDTELLSQSPGDDEGIVEEKETADVTYEETFLENAKRLKPIGSTKDKVLSDVEKDINVQEKSTEVFEVFKDSETPSNNIKKLVDVVGYENAAEEEETEIFSYSSKTAGAKGKASRKELSKRDYDLERDSEYGAGKSKRLQKIGKSDKRGHA
jgi:DNA-directed RNA polymerase beta subunit/DNA-directed RNA polymerase beta' subunit